MSAELPDSKLPRDPEFWERLAYKVAADAADPLTAYAATDAGDAADEDAGIAWYAPLARQARWLAAAAAAAAVVFWLAMPAREPAAARWLESSVAPNDAAGTLVGGSTPPGIEALMAQFAPEEEPQR